MASKKQLPVLTCEVTALNIKDNLPVFIEEADKFLNSIIDELKIPADFYVAKQDVKSLSDFEKALAKLKEEVLKKADQVHQITSTIDKFIEQAKKKRLPLNRKVEAETEKLKFEILDFQVNSINEYIEAANNTIAPVSLSHAHTRKDFADAGKGTKTLDTYTAAVKQRTKEIKELLKIRMDMLSTNLKTYEEQFQGEYSFLFTDLSSLVDNTPDNFLIACNGRVSNYKVTQLEKEKVTKESDEMVVHSEVPGDEIIDSFLDEQENLTAEQVEDINQENMVSGEQPLEQPKPKPVPPGVKKKPVPPGLKKVPFKVKSYGSGGYVNNHYNEPEEITPEPKTGKTKIELNSDDGINKFLVESIFKINGLKNKFINQLLIDHVKQHNITGDFDCVIDTVTIKGRVIDTEIYYAVTYNG